MDPTDPVTLRLPAGVQTRWASPENPRGLRGAGGAPHHGRKGSPSFFVRPGETLTLAQAEGPGVVRRIWMTLGDRSPAMLRSLRLRFFWDRTARPAVDVPLGDFFGAVLGTLPPFESAWFSSPEGRSFNCFLPMPFRDGMSIRIVNEGPETQCMLFYEINYTLGDAVDADTPYLHACYRSEHPTSLASDYQILPMVRGRGRYLGAHVGVVADTAAYGCSWWGEGECKIWLDGDGELPTLCGTGTEDWIGTGWELGRFCHRTQGCHLADHERMRFGLYRLHVDDPVYFQDSVRVAIQQIGSWRPEAREALARSGRRIVRAGPGGPAVVDFADPRTEPYGLFERQDAWSSCAYFSLDRPENDLPGLDPVEKRVADLPAYDAAEVNAVKMVPKEITVLRRWLPNGELMSVEELEELHDACGKIIAAIRSQEQALRDAAGGPRRP